jgi:hypothetical protein
LKLLFLDESGDHSLERMRDMSASLSRITNVTLSRSEGSDAKRPSASCRVRDGSRVASTSSMPLTDRNACVTVLRVRALAAIDRDYPVFVLGGVFVDRAYYRNELVPSVEQLKLNHFGRLDVILHTTDIIRARNGFERLTDPGARDRFYESLNQLMTDLEYTVIACAIRKDAHVKRYGEQAVDPYTYSLEMVVERFCHEIGDIEDGGVIFAEKRRPDLDDELDRQWKWFCDYGTDFIRAETVTERVVDLSSKSKKLNLAGLQLADLVVSPIGRHVLGKPDREDWPIVESKLRQVRGSYKGYGLKVLPG